MNEKRKYIIKSHIAINYKGVWYTQPTLTDEIAEEYLKLHPEDKVKFAKLPKEGTIPKVVKQSRVESENIKED